VRCIVEQNIGVGGEQISLAAASDLVAAGEIETFEAIDSQIQDTVVGDSIASVQTQVLQCKITTNAFERSIGDGADVGNVQVL
jgi:hypothetical protein